MCYLGITVLGRGYIEVVILLYDFDFFAKLCG